MPVIKPSAHQVSDRTSRYNVGEEMPLCSDARRAHKDGQSIIRYRMKRLWWYSLEITAAAAHVPIA